MSISKSQGSKMIDVSELIALSARLPAVHVDRTKFLRAQFDNYCDLALLERVLEVGPRQAGIPAKTVNLVAKSVITHETALVTAISTAAGIPGGWAMAATVPADLLNFHGAMIRIAQKLAYIHGWPQIFEDQGENIDDETRQLLLAFIGVMYGVAGAAGVVEKLAVHAAENASKQIAKQALTKTALYPILKKVGKTVGVTITKKTLSGAAGKAIPVLGGLLSGAITYASFKPMAQRLNAHFISRQKTKTRAVKRPTAS